MAGSFEKQIGFSRKPLARPYHGNTECRGDPTSVRALVLLESKLAELRHGDCLRQWFPPKDCGHVVGGRPRRCAWRARHDRRPRYRESVCRAEPNRVRTTAFSAEAPRISPCWRMASASCRKPNVRAGAISRM